MVQEAQRYEEYTYIKGNIKLLKTEMIAQRHKNV
jgi:hypothetical protein